MSDIAERLLKAIEAKEHKALLADSTAYDDAGDPVTAAGSFDWHVGFDSMAKWVEDGSDEKVALASDVDMISETWDAMTSGRIEFIVDNDPASVLRRCAADREIVESYIALRDNLARLDDMSLDLEWRVMGVVLKRLARGYGLEVEQ